MMNCSAKSLQPDELRDPACDVDNFKQFFQTILFGYKFTIGVTSALEVNVNVIRSVKSRFTYLLTYLLTYLPK